MTHSGDDEPLDAEIVPPDSAPPVQAPSYEDVTGYTPAGVPTFDHVRDKIEQRTATAIGSQELSEMSAEAEALDDAMAKREEAAKKKLEELRRSMGL
ncbi:hypothetical protein ACE11G_07620 [Gordonia sp. PS3]|uniref:PspA domain-containing protein n=1 Tax=Gordonia sihwensis NBRC 108236 TaxID=1223544 RepID=L7LG89_9ACTN|nr:MULTISPECIES: hypothetical protein [Gordonia]AUH68862.1 hypothetical protein CXX93_11440 [Gordonia sp. YC-JH1]KJR10030.1 hypothetical protein UG54_02555 [Gordonia sihwensis]KXT56313.1 hypothetical protein Y710_14715 [Gordonia sp. QH-12]MBY4570642.1 hypothetical protein [Gordonia sihwensis]WFN91260.1 hypothetical protein P5P27_10690 [Gordonia sihwensis]